MSTYRTSLKGPMEQLVLETAAALGVEAPEAIRHLLGELLLRRAVQSNAEQCRAMQSSVEPSASAASPHTPLSVSSSSGSIPPGLLPALSSPLTPLPSADMREPAEGEGLGEATRAEGRKRKKVEGCAPLPPPQEIDSPELRAALVDFEAHRRHMRKPINAEGWELLYRRLEAAGKGEAATAVRWAIAEGWRSWQLGWMQGMPWPEARRQLGMAPSTAPQPPRPSAPAFVQKLSPKGYALPIVATPWGPDEIAEFDEKMEAEHARKHQTGAVRPFPPDPAGAARRYPAHAPVEPAGPGSDQRAREVVRPPPAAGDLFAGEGRGRGS